MQSVKSVPKKENIHKTSTKKLNEHGKQNFLGKGAAHRHHHPYGNSNYTGYYIVHVGTQKKEGASLLPLSKNHLNFT